MANSILDDKTLVAYLSGTDAQRDEAFRALYASKLRSTVIHLVKQEGGNMEDGEDAFHDGLLALYRNIQAGRFKEAAALSTYFISTAIGIWKNRRRQIRSHPISEYDPNYFEGKEKIPSAEAEIINQEEINLIEAVIAQMGDRCQEILTRFWQSYKNEEVATILGLSNVATKKERYRCQTRIRAYLHSKPHLLELFKNMI